MKHSKSNLTPIAQTLRKNMTREEVKLWKCFLQPLPVVVKRQKVIGNYVVDFYIPKAKLVIELDGSQHYSETGIASDRKRDSDLNDLGLTVLHYSNLDVHRNFDGVCADIVRHIPAEIEIGHLREV